MVNTESEQRKRYIGPFSRAELESKIGPFQTSPISIIPKPGQPGKFRIIQNLSHPRNANPVPSVNAPINTSQFPCTWGTFATTCALIASLPPGTKVAVRDVAEAYRTIPIRQEQWPGLVVRLDGEDRFAVDTCCCFGLASSAGVHRIIGDAGADLMRAHGICYGTASCLIPSHLINHASPILSNELSNTSVWLCYGTAPQPLILSL